MIGIDCSRLPIRADRSIWSYRKVQRVVSTIIRGRRAFISPPQRGGYLDVGCGSNIRDDFCDLDYDWKPGVDICWDIRKPLPIEDNYIGGIYSEHCIEHIDFEDGRRLASEFFRIMTQGAYVRIVVPDGELYMLQYCEHLKGSSLKMPYSEADSVAGIYTPMMSINRIMRAHGHRFIYDFETLRAVLADVGFREIQRRTFGEGADARLLIDTPSRIIESLYVEARKA